MWVCGSGMDLFRVWSRGFGTVCVLTAEPGAECSDLANRGGLGTFYNGGNIGDRRGQLIVFSRSD